MKKPELTVIIVNYNTKELLTDCLDSIKAYRDEVTMEIIVSDNSSTDGSQAMIRKNFSWVKLIEGQSNEGFSKGNNRARPEVLGDMVLFLNPDTIIHKNVFAMATEYLGEHKDVGALTCKLVLPNGRLDKDARRRFPTPWISFKRLVLGLNRSYWYEDISEDSTHEVDAIQGAFFLTWKKVLDKVGWFDPKYFIDGEDVDLCFQIKKAGYKIIYYPETYITHIKKAAKAKASVNFRLAGVDSMEIFFKKNLWSNYPLLFDYFVILGIKLLKFIRYIRK